MILTALLFSTQITANDQIAENLPESEINYIHNFHIEALDSFLQERRYVVMHLTQKNCQTKTCVKRDVEFRKISLNFLEDEILFIRIPISSLTEASKILGHELSALPWYGMSFFGWKKHYEGNDLRHLKIWIKEIFETNPVKINSLSEIKPADEHFYVYFDKPTIEIEDFDVLMLSKMIHPISMYYGAQADLPENLERPAFNEILRWRETDTFLFGVRDYDAYVQPLNHKDPVTLLSQKIVNAEFPDQCRLNLKTMSYILTHRMPTVIYFDYDPLNQSFYTEFRELYRKYRNYLLFCSLDLNKVQNSENPKWKFYGNFLAGGVPRTSQKGFLRLVNYDGDFQRYKVFGKLSLATGDFLIKNFLHGNIRKYRASESLGDKNYIILKSGMRKINKIKWDEMLNHKLTTHLVYIYSSMSPDFESHMKVLMDLSRAIEKNKRFSISLLDHDRNDLDGHVHEELPLLVLSNKVFERRKFEGEFSFRGVIGFLAENVSWLKLNEEFLPELRDVHGIDLIEEDL